MADKTFLKKGKGRGGRKKKNSSYSKFNTRKSQLLALFRREPTDSRVTARWRQWMCSVQRMTSSKETEATHRKVRRTGIHTGPRFDFCFKTFVSRPRANQEPIRPTFRALRIVPTHYCSLRGAYAERGEFTRLLPRLMVTWKLS